MIRLIRLCCPGYALSDLAGDALGILDAVSVDRAHLVCRSMAGGIGLIAGVDHPDRAEKDVARTRNMASAMTNHYSMDFDGPTRGGFADIVAPTLVVHGDHDPLFPMAHGEALRDAVPGARLLVLPGAGHDVPEPLWDVFVPALVDHTTGAPR